LRDTHRIPLHGLAGGKTVTVAENCVGLPVEYH